MRLSAKLAGLVWLSAFFGAAQTVRFSGSVSTGETYRHPIGRGLVLAVTSDGIEVHAAGGEGRNFAQCVTTPVRGPNALDFLATDFDPARGGEAPSLRRSFHFVLNAADDEAECAELGRVMDPDAKENHWYSHRMGSAVVTLADVKLSRPAADKEAEVQSLRFSAVVHLPRVRKRQRVSR